MKTKLFYLILMMSCFLQVNAQNNDLDVDIFMTTGSVYVNKTGLLKVSACNLGDPNIVKNSFIVRVTVESGLEIVGLDASSNPNFTLKNTITPGNGNFADITNSGTDLGAATSYCYDDIYLVIKGKTIVTAPAAGSGIKAIISYIFGTNPLLGGATNDSQGDLSTGNNSSTSSLNVVASLPVTLRNFAAIKNSNQVSLNWDYAADNQFSHFEIEKSTDALSFSSLDNKQYAPAADAIATGMVSHFNTADTKPAIGNNYYRLKMLEKDGSFSYSQILKVNFDGNTSAISVYPNPIVNTATVNAASLQSNSRLKLYNVFGSVVAQYAASSSTQINMAALPAGTYMLELVNAKGERKGMVKLLKINQ